MSGHRPFDAPRSRMSPERHERNRLAGELLAGEVALQEARAVRQLPRGDDAVSALEPAIAELERRGDMSVGDLARSIEALGGRLVITAEFPEQSMTLRLGIQDDRGGSEIRGS